MGSRSPLVGYNHNIRYNDRIYHVQTEDSGVDNPHIYTHLFHDGMIISSARTDYGELLDDPDQREKVRRLMQEQHKRLMKQLRQGELDSKIIQMVGTLQPAEALELAAAEEQPATAAAPADLPLQSNQTLPDAPPPAEPLPASGKAATLLEGTTDPSLPAIAAPLPDVTQEMPALKAPVLEPHPTYELDLPENLDELDQLDLDDEATMRMSMPLGLKDKLFPPKSDEPASPPPPQQDRLQPVETSDLSIEARSKGHGDRTLIDTGNERRFGSPAAAVSDRRSPEAQEPDTLRLAPEALSRPPALEAAMGASLDEETAYIEDSNEEVTRAFRYQPPNRVGGPGPQLQPRSGSGRTLPRISRNELPGFEGAPGETAEDSSVIVDQPPQEPAQAGATRSPTFYSEVRQRQKEADEQASASRVFEKPVPGSPAVPTQKDAATPPLTARRSGVYPVPGNPPPRPPHPDSSVRRSGPPQPVSPSRFRPPGRLPGGASGEGRPAPATPGERPPWSRPPVPAAEGRSAREQRSTPADSGVVTRPVVMVGGSPAAAPGQRSRYPRPPTAPYENRRSANPTPATPARVVKMNSPSLFGSDLITERSLDEVILSYLAEDVDTEK